jgi:hypothetical protein
MQQPVLGHLQPGLALLLLLLESRCCAMYVSSRGRLCSHSHACCSQQGPRAVALVWQVCMLVLQLLLPLLPSLQLLHCHMEPAAPVAHACCPAAAGLLLLLLC